MDIRERTYLCFSIARIDNLQREVLSEPTPNLQGWEKLESAKKYLYDRLEGRR